MRSRWLKTQWNWTMGHGWKEAGVAAVTTTGKHLSPETWCHFCCILLTWKSPDLPSLGLTGRMYARGSAAAGLLWGSSPGTARAWCAEPARSRPIAQPQDCVLPARPGHCCGTGPLSHPAAALSHPALLWAALHREVTRSREAWVRVTQSVQDVPGGAAFRIRVSFPHCGQFLILGIHILSTFSGRLQIIRPNCIYGTGRSSIQQTSDFSNSLTFYIEKSSANR